MGTSRVLLIDRACVSKRICCGRASLRGDFCGEACTMSNKDLNRRDLLSQAMSEETRYNKRGKQKQQRETCRSSCCGLPHASTPRGQRVEAIETARIKQRTREENERHPFGT